MLEVQREILPVEFNGIVDFFGGGGGVVEGDGVVHGGGGSAMLHDGCGALEACSTAVVSASSHSVVLLFGEGGLDWASRRRLYIVPRRK